MSRPARSARARAAAAALLALACVAVASGCRGDRENEPPRQFFPGMDDQPKYKVQSESGFFDDHRSMRQPVAGTVAFGRDADAGAADRYWLLRDDPEVFLGVNPDGSFVERIPMRKLVHSGEDRPVTPEQVQDVLNVGRRTFNIYCIVCHGGTGMGDGMVGRRWATPVPSFHQPQYMPGGEKGQDGYVFHVIRNGLANVPGALPALRMPSYASQIDEREAWAVVAYFRAIQRARGATIDNVPEQIRQDLMRSMPRPTADSGGADGDATAAALTTGPGEEAS